MDKIYEQSKDLHVVATKVYVDDGKAYKDAAFSAQFKTSELTEAVIKGAILVLDEDSYAYPIKYSITTGVGTVAYIVPNSITATSADIAGAVSAADA